MKKRSLIIALILSTMVVLSLVGLSACSPEKRTDAYLREDSLTFAEEYTAKVDEAEDYRQLPSGDIAQDGEVFWELKLTITRDADAEDEKNAPVVYIEKNWFTLMAGEESCSVYESATSLVSFKLSPGETSSTVTLYFLAPVVDSTPILKIANPLSPEKSAEIILTIRPQ